MLPMPAGREASAGVAASLYQRHRPERFLLYQLVEEHYPAFKAHLAARGSALPGYVEREFEAYLECGRLERGFLRVRSAATTRSGSPSAVSGAGSARAAAIVVQRRDAGPAQCPLGT